MKKLTLFFAVLILASCNQKPSKTLFGSWECIAEQCGSYAVEEPSDVYYFEIRGKCEEIEVYYREVGGDPVSSLTEYPVMNAKCSNRNELTFDTENLLTSWPLGWHLKLDPSGDTLKGIRFFSDSTQKPYFAEYDTCRVVLVRVN